MERFRGARHRPDGMPSNGTAERSAGVRLPGVELAPIDRFELESLVLRRLDEGRGGWIVTANLDILRQCVADPSLGELVGSADVVVADGMPLVWAARLARRPLPERVTGADLVSSLAGRAAAAGRSVYLLGGRPGSAEAAAGSLAGLHPGLRVAGWDCPPLGFERSAAQLDAIEQRIVEAAPDIAYIGLGFPKQERLIARLRAALPGAWFVGVGVGVDFAAGRVRRAPLWMQRTGLEWLYRMRREPAKLTARYLVHDLPAAFRLFRWALAVRWGRRGAGAERSRGAPR